MHKLKLNDEDNSYASFGAFAPTFAQFKVEEGFYSLFLIGCLRVHRYKIYKIVFP